MKIAPLYQDSKRFKISKNTNFERDAYANMMIMKSDAPGTI